MSSRATLHKPTERFQGAGLHSGSPSWLQILPSEASSVGILFRNYSTGGEVSAAADSVVSTERCTCLASSTIRVDTVEHVLSALYGCGISDAVVLFDGRELPIGDGSAHSFVELIELAGMVSIEGQIDDLTIDRQIVIDDGNGSVLTAVPSDSFWMVATVDYSRFPAIGVQSAKYTGTEYKSEIAFARTYGFYYELEALHAIGLGKGVSLENVVALGSDGSADSRTPLRAKDELVRHKMLDLLGDLSLSQKRLQVGIVALRPSHTMNVRLAKALLSFDGS